MGTAFTALFVLLVAFFVEIQIGRAFDKWTWIVGHNPKKYPKAALFFFPRSRLFSPEKSRLECDFLLGGDDDGFMRIVFFVLAWPLRIVWGIAWILGWNVFRALRFTIARQGLIGLLTSIGSFLHLLVSLFFTPEVAVREMREALEQRRLRKATGVRVETEEKQSHTEKKALTDEERVATLRGQLENMRGQHARKRSRLENRIVELEAKIELSRGLRGNVVPLNSRRQAS